MRTLIFASAVVNGFEEAAALHRVEKLVRETPIRLINILTAYTALGCT